MPLRMQILIVAVGSNSEWGKTMELVGAAGDEKTPLQAKLEILASTIGKVGLAVALSCFIVLFIQ